MIVRTDVLKDANDKTPSKLQITQTDGPLNAAVINLYKDR